MADLRDHLRRHYAIDEPLRPLTGESITGQRNAALQAGNWFVKLFAPSRVPEPLVEQSLRVQEAVRTVGMPAPQVLRSQDGSLYTSFDDHYLAVMEYVPGQTLVPGHLDPAQAAVVGEVLARLHGALARVAPAAESPQAPDPERILADWRALREAAAGGRALGEINRDGAAAGTALAEINRDGAVATGTASTERNREEAAAGTALAELSRYVAEATAYREAMLQQFSLGEVDWADQPWQLIHGDFHVGNLRWGEQNDVRAVIDFDGCGHGYIACEVGEAWLLNCRNETEVAAPEVEAAFLSGYLRHCRLTRAQWLAIPHVWWAMLAARTWPVSDVYERPGSYDPDRALRVALKRERQVCWVGEHLAEMGALLAQVWDARPESPAPDDSDRALSEPEPDAGSQAPQGAGGGVRRAPQSVVRLDRMGGLVSEQARPKVLVIEEHKEIWHRTLPTGFRAIGCPVVFDTEVQEAELERTLTEFQPAFALMMGWTQTHTPARRRVVRRLLDRYGVPLVYWAVEDAEWLEHWSLPLVRDLRPDLVVTINAACIERYKAEGFRAGYLPFGCNPELHRRVPPRPEYQCDVALVANFYPVTNFPFRERSLADMVKPLLERGYDLKIWGRNWDRAPEFGLNVPEGVVQGALPYAECAAVYSTAMIVLGLQNNQSPTQFTMRTCEVLGSGGLLLTSDTPAVRNLFEHGRHLLMSDSPERTVELVDYYLKHEEERARIAAAGQAEVYARHTYAERAWGLLGLLETGGE